MTFQQGQLTASEIRKRNLLKKEKPCVYEKVIKYYEKFEKGESIAIVQLQYDYACNFHCQHCSISSFQRKNNDRFFTIPDIWELSRQMDEMGLAHVDITGGEPLVFPDLDELVEALDPSKFYLQCDTNGWLMTDEKAKHLKSIGIDKIQLSLDSFLPTEHDAFRQKAGSYERALRAIDSIQKAGLSMHIATVITHQRAQSEELVRFLEFAKSKGTPVSYIWPKPVGQWEGCLDILATPDDVAYIEELSNKYNMFNHLTPGYGIDAGCIAVKRMISITKYGDIMPCPWMYFSLGNFFKEPLKDILDRGMEYFKRRSDICLVSNDRKFIDKYIVKTYGKKLPVPIEQIFSNEDRLE